MRTFLFYAFATVAVASALICITRRSPVASALWLVNTLFNVAGLYVVLDAHFIAAAQVLVYAGAIMVLFLFVIMLLNIGRLAPGTSDLRGAGGRIVAAVAGLLMIGELVVLRRMLPPSEFALPEGAVQRMVAEQGAVNAVAIPLFKGYLVPFEVTSIMLLAAIVGSVVLAKRKL